MVFGSRHANVDHLLSVNLVITSINENQAIAAIKKQIIAYT